MKKITLTLLATMFVAGTILNGCNTQAEQANDSQENLRDRQNNLADAKQDLEVTPTDSISRFQKFKDESNAIISDNERRIAELKINIKNEKTEAKATYERDVNALDRKNRGLKKKLARLQRRWEKRLEKIQKGI